MHINKDEEQLIKDLFEGYEPSEPSKDFTKLTMDKVLHEWSSQPIKNNIKISTSNKVWIIVAACLAALLVYFFDVKNIADETALASSFNMINLQETMHQLLRSVCVGFEKIPSILYVIALGVSALLILDKTIQKTVKS